MAEGKHFCRRAHPKRFMNVVVFTCSYCKHLVNLELNHFFYLVCFAFFSDLVEILLMLLG